MKIAGIETNSFIDYPGRLSAVVFTSGCNMDCFYCHNRRILNEVQTLVDDKEVIDLLKKRKGFLDGVVITGGEPTLQTDLEDFILKVKELGYPVKLDTNGTNPKLLKRLIHKGLLDYVAMDIKASLHRYEEICQADVNMDLIERSIDILLSGRVDYEFRTTFVPQLKSKDILYIAQRIKGARLYVLQQFKNTHIVQDTHDVNDYRLLRSPHDSEYILGTLKRVKDFVQSVETRGVNFSNIISA